MNWTKNILSLLMIVVFCADELSAQTTSSASQVVTFSARRIMQEARTDSYAVNTTNRRPFKVTAGFQSRLQADVVLNTTTTGHSFSFEDPAATAGARSLRPAIATPESDQFFLRQAITKSEPSRRLLLTLTE